MSRLFHDPSRRHPRCPQCHYDLVATIAANKRICPECGRRFTMSELARAPRAGDWTPGKGIAWATVSLLLRAVIILPVWAGLVWLITPAINFIPVSISWFIVLGGCSAIPGVPMGHALTVGLNERAGMQSVVVTGIAFAFAAAAVTGGMEVAQIWRPMPWWSLFIAMATTLFAAVWIVRNTLFET